MGKRLSVGLLALVLFVLGWTAYRWSTTDEAPTSVASSGEPSEAIESSWTEELLESEPARPELTMDEVKLSTDASNARAHIEEPAPAITLIGRVQSVSESRMPDLEITIDVAGNVNKVFVAAGMPYRVSGIPPGRAHVVITAGGYEPLAEDRDIRDAPLEQKLNFYMRPIELLLVKLLAPNGHPLFEALHGDGSFSSPPEIAIVATTELPGRLLPMSEENGELDYSVGVHAAHFALRDWSDSSEYSRLVQLTPPYPIYLSACRSGVVLATEQVTAGMREVSLVVSLDALHASNGEAHWRIVEATSGGSLEDARAKLEREQPRGQYIVHERTRRSAPVADSELPLVGGEATVRDLEPGSYTLTVSAPGREQLREKVRIGAGAVTELGSLRLSRIGVIEGTVVDGHGGVARAHVELFPLVGEIAEGLSPAEDCFSDASGHFAFERAGSRRYLLNVWSKSGVARTMVVDASNGDVHGVTVVLGQGVPITLRLDPVLQEANKHGSEYSISVSDDRHFRIQGTSISTGGNVTLRLPAGSYSYEVTFHGARIESRSFDVESTRLELTIGS